MSYLFFYKKKKFHRGLLKTPKGVLIKALPLFQIIIISIIIIIIIIVVVIIIIIIIFYFIFFIFLFFLLSFKKLK